MRREGKERLIRKPELMALLGLSDATVWRMERAGKFPKRLQIGGNSVAWLESEVEAWIGQRAAERIDPESRATSCGNQAVVQKQACTCTGAEKKAFTLVSVKPCDDSRANG